MQVISGAAHLNESFQASIVTIGNFDGLHLGHQLLLRRAIEYKKQFKSPAIVYTFYPHPAQVLKPSKKHFQLFPLEDQVERFSRYGFDYLVVEPFSRDFSELSAEDFLNNYLAKYLRPQIIIVGHDFNFGSHQQGDIDFLTQYCQRLNWQLEVVPVYKHQGRVVSSSWIREALKKSEMKLVTELLGRPYSVSGIVLHGAQRGRQLGVPTANIQVTQGAEMRLGVYATKTKFDGQEYKSITNVGISPTFTSEIDPIVKVETHIFDYRGDLYGQKIQVEFIDFIRPEKKFDSIESLKKQIEEDFSAVKRLLQ